MQKVERQNHKDRGQKRLIGLLLCAVLLIGGVTAGILLSNKAKEEEIITHQHISGTITQRNAGDLASLTVTQRGKDSWTAVREEDGSMRLQPEDESMPVTWLVDESIAGRLTDAAVNLTYDDVFTENRSDWEPDADDFGLKDPLVTAVFRYTDETEITVHFGDSADPDDNAYYYMTVDGDDRLYAVAAGTLEDLNMEKELLHPVQSMEIRGALLDRVTVKNGDGTVRTEWTLQGQVSDRDAAENWMLTEPFVYPADYDAMKNLRDSAENLALGVYIGEAEEEALARCGLDQPAAVIELHMAAGSTGTVSDQGVYDVVDWEERTETLTIGNSKSEMVAYVRFGDEIFTISHFSVNVFTQTDPLSTVARYTVATPLNSLESVTVEKAECADEYRIEKIEETQNTEQTEETQQYRCLKNGEEISYDTFSAAWERLLTVTVSGRLPKDWELKESHTKYTLRTVSGGAHTIALSDYDGMHDAVTLDGHTIFYLIKGGMTELP
ncbi:MAG: DUF4340 domain-containing protein [Clostridia bacterium]|nr:DUF4340 domain-containing protein [Clostridia bacterium]